MLTPSTVAQATLGVSKRIIQCRAPSKLIGQAMSNTPANVAEPSAIQPIPLNDHAVIAPSARAAAKTPGVRRAKRGLPKNSSASKAPASTAAVSAVQSNVKLNDGMSAQAMRYLSSSQSQSRTHSPKLPYSTSQWKQSFHASATF